MKRYKKKKNHNVEKSDTGTFFPPRLGNGFQTVCDVDIHPDDKMNYLMKKDVRHVGTGIPKVKTLALAKGLKKSNPCLYEATMAHEQVHVKNAKANCKAFKKCLDDEVANNIFSNSNSTEEYNHCKEKHSGGLASDCKKDEQEAYKKAIEIAEKLLEESKCASEKANFTKNIKIWKTYAVTPPNC